MIVHITVRTSRCARLASLCRGIINISSETVSALAIFTPRRTHEDLAVNDLNRIVVRLLITDKSLFFVDLSHVDNSIGVRETSISIVNSFNRFCENVYS